MRVSGTEGPEALLLFPQGNIVLAAESEAEQNQWLEMLQESGKVYETTATIHL